ncbi:hypothetical protein GGR28_001055 [Lewinella aquimaris]|uniref:Uncharacterized protein n=1 Tax=Neolewinella aquimaris TaxID=1835722 RepID=A0A840E3X2_9BACT|nr:hypothetical protein [Neolewinella aquimaris]MBB4078442.1 hypothetical protein [Neolewinella aquimaris]
MSNLQDTCSTFGGNTVAYLDRLDGQSAEVVRLIQALPIPPALQSHLHQTWRITRQKLAYFRRELSRSDGELQEELEVLHSTLLPEVISYQIRLGAMMISDTCPDHQYLNQWKSIWSNFDLD